jgi:hypothetical protein
VTPKQRTRFYFPAWNATAKAHHWRTSEGRLIGQRLDCWSNPKLNEVYQRIWNLAEQWAAAERRALRPDDFRHACHVVALGRDKSSANLTNDELDRVVALFGLLADPDDLRATMAWLSPNEARRKRMLWWIRNHCVESYVVAICREKFGADEPATLRFDQLHQLHMTLRHRPNARRSAGRPPAPLAVAAHDNQPF